MSIRAIILISAMAFLSACNQKPVQPPFDAAVKAHFESIQNRDIEAFTKTITGAENLPMIFPDGSMLTTRQEVIDFHTAWFADKSWVYTPEVIGTLVREGAAVATVRYQYQDTPDGPPRFAYRGLVFELQGGEWRLIHDQNTRISIPE